MRQWFTFSGSTLAILIIVYGFAASALPVWLLLAPRDYLSTFVKLGTIGLLAVGIVAAASYAAHAGAYPLHRRNRSGVRRKHFPFAFITIACGAISGFHSLISSGTTPKLIRRETETRMVGYGAMMAESLVAIMATDRRLRAAAGNLFRHQQSGGHCGTGTGSGGSDHHATGDFRSPPLRCIPWPSSGEQTLFNRTGGARPSPWAWRTFFLTAWAAKL